MSHMERVVKAVNYLVQVTCINGIVDPDLLLSPEYRATFDSFDEVEQAVLFDVIRTMFGDELDDPVKLLSVFYLSTLDQHAVFHALNMAFGAVNEGAML